VRSGDGRGDDVERDDCGRGTWFDRQFVDAKGVDAEDVAMGSIAWWGSGPGIVGGAGVVCKRRGPYVEG
jgi:hypothetical protein